MRESYDFFLPISPSRGTGLQALPVAEPVEARQPVNQAFPPGAVGLEALYLSGRVAAGAQERAGVGGPDPFHSPIADSGETVPTTMQNADHHHSVAERAQKKRPPRRTGAGTRGKRREASAPRRQCRLSRGFGLPEGTARNRCGAGTTDDNLTSRELTGREEPRLQLDRYAHPASPVGCRRGGRPTVMLGLRATLHGACASAD